MAKPVLDRYLNYLAQDPNNSNLLIQVAFLYYDTNQLTLARHYALQALAINLDNAYGQLILLLVDPDELTVKKLTSLKKLIPKESRLWFVLGNLYLQQENYSLAESHFTQAIELHPNFYEYLLSLAWCYLFQNQLKKAKDVFKQLTLLNANRCEGFGGLGLAYALLNNLSSAKIYLSQAYERQSNCFAAKIAEIICDKVSNPKLNYQRLRALFPSAMTDIENIILSYFDKQN